MQQSRAPLIFAGQLYLNSELNEYLIVTKNHREQIYYAGVGFRGHFEDETFLDHFKPVDPADVDPAELRVLESLCGDNIKASIGFIRELQNT